MLKNYFILSSVLIFFILIIHLLYFSIIFLKYLTIIYVHKIDYSYITYNIVIYFINPYITAKKKSKKIILSCFMCFSSFNNTLIFHHFLKL